MASIKSEKNLEKIENFSSTKDIYTLSCGQEALYFLNQLAPESWAYNTLFAVRIGSEINLTAWQAALRETINRHLTLTTTYTERNGKIVGVVRNRLELPFQQIDASNWTDPQLDDRLK